MKNNKNKKKTAVFIDYESWYYGLQNLHNQRPDVGAVLSKIEKGHDVVLRKCFGNLPLGKGVDKKERSKLKRYGYKLENTHQGSSRENIKENLTDFVVVDQIYRMLINDKDREIEKLIIFSGDAHYLQALRTVKEFNIEVEIRAVMGTVSHVFGEFTVIPILPIPKEDIRNKVEEELYLANSLSINLNKKKLIKRVNGKNPDFDVKDIENEINILMAEGKLTQKKILTSKNKRERSLLLTS